MSDKLIGIAKECGASECRIHEDYTSKSIVFDDIDQLRATVEQVAGPLVACLEFVAMSPSPADKQYAIEALSAYTEIMGEKK